MARVCDLFGHVLVFVVPVLNFVLNLVPVLVPVYIAKLVQKRLNYYLELYDLGMRSKLPFGLVRPRGPNQGGRICVKVV
jgi:hypothetical protein